jgi:hypothetical protein
VVFVTFLFARTWRDAYFQMFDKLLWGLEIFVAVRRCLGSERACSLVVTRAPVAPQVLGSTPRGSEFLRI